MPFDPVQAITQSVYGAGEHQGTVVPWPAGATAVSAAGLLSDLDLADAGKALHIVLMESFDGGLTFQRGPDGEWVGGVTGAHGGFAPPSVGTSYVGSGSPPTHVSVAIDLPAPCSVGAVINFS